MKRTGRTIPAGTLIAVFGALAVILSAVAATGVLWGALRFLSLWF